MPRGPAPKDPSARRRRNQPTRGEWTILDRPPVKAPPLPRPSPKGGFSAPAKAEWGRWWASPMAAMWDASDRGMVELLLRMIDAAWEHPQAASATQIRLFRDGLGLSPKGRRDLRWLLPGEAPPQLDVIDGGKADSNVRRLRAVDES